MTMTIFEKKALYAFGCPNREATVERLHMIAVLAPDCETKKLFFNLAVKLSADCTGHWYPCFFRTLREEMAFVVALPREVPLEMCPQMLKEYCEEHFVSKGMCCDFAIHDPDPPGHNPHCHIMLTMRAIDENGKWLPKSRKVYDLDENGERIKLPSGRWKSHKEDTVDWNEQYHAEEWRHGWEVIQNKYLELAGSPERVDMRSYARQGVDVKQSGCAGTGRG